MGAHSEIGITAWGSYVPRWRLERASAVSAMAWHAPALRTLQSGTRSVCHHDEDTLTMAVAAARRALCMIDVSRTDALFLCSTTLPYEERLSSGIVKTALGFDDGVVATDITGSRRAGISGLLAALDRTAAAPHTRSLVVASDTPPGRPGSADELLFGDGAAAVTVGTEKVVARFAGRFTITRDFVDRYRKQGAAFDYVWEDRWIAAMGYETFIPKAVAGLLEENGLSLEQIAKVIFPCPSARRHAEIGVTMGCRPEQVADHLSATIGETGAAHPLLMLCEVLQGAAPGDRIIVCGFGSGVEALLFEVTDRIESRRHLTQTAPTTRRLEPYTRFLAYRGLLFPESGIRGEKPQKTALSLLYREQEILLGLQGGQCRICGTPQLPVTAYCVNPACRKPGPFRPYGFAHRAAKVKSFTGDYLVPSPAPPHIYGLIQFDGGGRMMAEFTDCDLDEVSVGAKVAMTFRRRYEDEARGFVGYFWKAFLETEVAS